MAKKVNMEMSRKFMYYSKLLGENIAFADVKDDDRLWKDRQRLKKKLMEILGSKW